MADVALAFKIVVGLLGEIDYAGDIVVVARQGLGTALEGDSPVHLSAGEADDLAEVAGVKRTGDKSPEAVLALDPGGLLAFAGNGDVLRLRGHSVETEDREGLVGSVPRTFGV